ncbi:MAG: response regulator [Desulfobacteraceae bacterium]|nr:response regulator [Desulfobacteraceae bacterium]
MVKRILVVEDETHIRKMMEAAFSRSGFEVHCVGSAEDALEFVETRRYMIFFLDLNLPGMNGIDLCRLIRKDNPFTICFAVTGFSTTFEVFDCRDAGFEDYFTKPVEIKVLIGAAERAFEKLARWRRDDTKWWLNSHNSQVV